MELLRILYAHIDKTFSNFPLSCREGCNLCCTRKVYVTSLEGCYVLEVLKESQIKKLYELTDYPRPKLTHNQTVLCYLQGTEPPLEEMVSTEPCPFLDEKGLCVIYERRPLMCRITASLKPCDEEGAILPHFLFQVGLIGLQLVESIDLGGVYGNLIDILKFLRDCEKKGLDEVPEYLISNIELEELPILPEESDLKRWVGQLYRTSVKEDKTFRDQWQELREKFKPYKTLSFLEEIFENV